MLIPYDPNSLRQLWKAQSDGDDSRVATAFLDKMFQLRFHVPPLLLSDWRAYLVQLFEQALPNHNSAEFHSAYRVCRIETIQVGMPPTPRDLKMFVNQVGTITRQWQDTFPLSQVAYFVLLGRREPSVDVPKGLLDRTQPEEPFSDVLGDSAEDHLAAMAFNVPVSQARQLLLRDPLEQALGQGDREALQKLTENAGFWEVILDIPFSEWVETESAKLANAAYCLGHDGLSDDAEPLVEMVVNSLYKAAKMVKIWAPFNTSMAEGLLALLALRPDEALASSILERLPAVAVKTDQAGEDTDATKNWAAGLDSLLRGMQMLGLQAAYTEGIEIETSAEGYIELCAQMHKQDRRGEFWQFIRPSVQAGEVSTALETLASTDQFSDKHVDAIRVLKARTLKPAWNNIATKITERLQAADTKSPQVIRAALEALWELHDVDANIDAQINNLATQGHLLHHLHHVKADAAASAWCVFMFLLKVPAATQPSQAGNSQEGFNYLTNQIFGKPADHKLFTDEFADRLAYTGKFDLLFKILDKASSAKEWVKECLKMVDAHENALSLYTPQVILKRWKFLQGEFPAEEFNRLIGTLVTESPLVEFLSARDFEVEQVGFYLAVAQNGGVATTMFCQWCRDGLADIDADRWQLTLKGEGPVAKLLIHLIDNEVQISLGTQYQDALTAHGKLLIAGKTKPQEFAEHWNTLLKPLDTTGRNLLRSQLLEAAGRAEGKIAPEFFDLYGDEIADQQALSEDHDVVMNLFIPLLQARHEKGLQWIANIFTAHPDILDGYSDAHVNGFKARVQEVIDGPEEEISSAVRDTADHLDIHRMEPSPSEEQEEEE